MKSKAKLVEEFAVSWHVLRKESKKAAAIVEEIKRRELYKPATWQDFCREELGITRQAAEHLLLLAEMSTVVDVDNARQARALRGADAETAQAAVALAALEKKTAAKIQTAKELIEQETAGLQGEEKTNKTAEILRREENRARASGGKRRSRKDGILGILGDVGKRLQKCQRLHEGLTDVADACDRQMKNVENELEAYETLVRGSREDG